MPIKEIIAIALTLVTATAIFSGPSSLEKSLNTMKYQLLKELTKTNTWGDPSPWRHQKPNSNTTHLKNN